MGLERIIPPRIGPDGRVSYYSTTSPPDDSCAVCYVMPDHIVPVVFVPGIMGSNLMDENGEAVWLVDSTWTVASEWGGALPEKRRRLLDPAKTFVYREGILPTGTALSDEELRRRGWGEVGAMSYGDFLPWLEQHLNDYLAKDGYGRKGLRAGLIRHVLKPDLPLLKYEEVAASYHFRFPVHAVGYNWLQPNQDSAKRLKERVAEFIEYYRKRQFRCDKVILVTHSMGGLVARYFTEEDEGADDVLGVVHGVMPATGAAAAYRRVKAGTEGAAGWVLGANAAEVTAVFATAPGALQLLPGKDYGTGWLKVRDFDRVVSLPVQDPYDEIYLQRGKWWGLINDRFLNPLDVHRTQIESDWLVFNETVNELVKPFHSKISRKYHRNTYAFYGDDADTKTWGDVVWKRAIGRDVGARPPKLVPYIHDLLGGQIQWDHGYGRLGVSIERGAPGDSAYFVLREATESGDGTVPARSGKAPVGCPGVRYCVPFKDFGHEAAFKNDARPGITNWARNDERRLFTLWSITRIASEYQTSASRSPR
ncbi:lipase family alpha/beta hydrolase [Cupriavidus agavae]|uniref:Lecithin:cholesterol acyltransferase n=1 Tax=Cupriavidus agavae TaxID=1001822 RepID=A0A4V2FI04_9BURK|nr:hypothetical protein [Cupriavidus agavae]RZT42089.1 lecithin:cholesterol acyltransferase [Cupriavidus agavae]